MIYLTLAKWFAIFSLIAGVSYLAYDKVYFIGYTSAEEVYKTKIEVYEREVAGRVRTIELNSTVIIEQNVENRLKANKDFAAILQAAKAKPLTTIINNECSPSPDLIKAYNEAITRANQK